jgi:hypothetical protein
MVMNLKTYGNNVEICVKKSILLGAEYAAVPLIWGKTLASRKRILSIAFSIIVPQQFRWEKFNSGHNIGNNKLSN